MPAASTPVETLAVAGMAAHLDSRLKEASACYRQLLDLEPPVRATGEQFALIRRFAPRLHTVPGEFFPLKDVVAVLHPERPFIGYHLFWEDDIDFPDDNQPCDHEIVWVEFDPVGAQVLKVTSYLHGGLADGCETAADANRHGGRPWIGVEWGKHGSIPWRGTELGNVDRILRRNWEKLHRTGRRCPDHPLAQGWPAGFAGNYAAYKDFSVPVDPRTLLDRYRFTYLSRWPNAVINLHCLRYNFSPKKEWPWLVGGGP